MEKITLFSYLKCSTCRKASKWLDQNNIKYQLRDIVRKPPSTDILKLVLEKYSTDKKKIFNTKGKSFKLLDINIADLSNKEIIQLLSSNGKLIKRPMLVINQNRFLVGFKESDYKNFFKINNYE